MKQSILLSILLLISQLIFCQTEITPQRLQKIKLEVEAQTIKFRTCIINKNQSEEQIQFSMDTFRINKISESRMKIDYSTIGMNTAIAEMTAAYDKLLNKYYNKLLKSLKGEDKKTFILAQRSWLSYRDSEFKLVQTLAKDSYSGGGTIQSNIVIGAYSDMVLQRTLTIFDYYDRLIKE